MTTRITEVTFWDFMRFFFNNDKHRFLRITCEYKTTFGPSLPSPKRFDLPTPLPPPPPPRTTSNLPSSPHYSAIPTGNAVDHYISRSQCLQLINRVKISIFFPVCYNSFNASRTHELNISRIHAALWGTTADHYNIIFQRSYIKILKVSIVVNRIRTKIDFIYRRSSNSRLTLDGS